MKKLLTLLLSFFFVANLSAQTILRGPYLQNISDSSVQILWQTDQACTSKLRFKSGETWQVIDLNEAKFEHQIELDKLESNSEVHYQILLSQEHASPLYKFKTAPPINSEHKVRLAVLGDSGSGDANQQAVASAIKDWNPDLIMHTGDIVYPNGEYENYDQRYFQPYKNLIEGVAVFPTLGNHDIPNLATYLRFFRPRYKESFSNSPEYYFFTYGNLLAIALNSNGDLSPESEQYKWLLRVLEQQSKLYFWRIIFLHHPPYSVTERGENQALIANLVPLVRRFAVDLVLAGHDHNYQRFELPTVVPTIDSSTVAAPVFVVTGGGGKRLYPKANHHPYLKFFKEQFHFLGIVFDNKNMQLQALDTQGQAFDKIDLSVNSKFQ